MEKEMRQREAIRMMEWITEYPESVDWVADVEESTTPEGCIKTIDQLEEYGFEYLVPLLLHTVSYDYTMDRVISRIYAESLAAAWNQRGTAHILDDMKGIIKEEIARSELREKERSEKKNKKPETAAGTGIF